MEIGESAAEGAETWEEANADVEILPPPFAQLGIPRILTVSCDAPALCTSWLALPMLYESHS